MLITKSCGKVVIAALKSGGIGILPTDTIYGIVGSALRKKTVERIYKLRRRNPKKQMIILIGDMGQATWDKFGIAITLATRKYLHKVWPGKVSIILEVKSKKLKVKRRYLHRGTNTLAFRLPKPLWLRKLLGRTGPLVAPSANREGAPPAKTIREAKKYFGSKVDFYVDAGCVDSAPSTLVKIENGKVIVLRP